MSYGAVFVAIISVFVNGFCFCSSACFVLRTDYNVWFSNSCF